MKYIIEIEADNIDQLHAELNNVKKAIVGQTQSLQLTPSKDSLSWPRDEGDNWKLKIKEA